MCTVIPCDKVITPPYSEFPAGSGFIALSGARFKSEWVAPLRDDNPRLGDQQLVSDNVPW